MNDDFNGIRYLLLDFYRRGKDATDIPGLEPIDNLDDIAKGDKLFLPGEGPWFEEGRVTNTNRRNGVVTVRGKFFRDLYDPTDFSPISRKAAVKSPVIITQQMVDQGLVYRVLLQK